MDKEEDNAEKTFIHEETRRNTKKHTKTKQKNLPETLVPWPKVLKILYILSIPDNPPGPLARTIHRDHWPSAVYRLL